MMIANKSDHAVSQKIDLHHERFGYLSRLLSAIVPTRFFRRTRDEDRRPRLVQRSETLPSCSISFSNMDPVDDHPQGYPQLAAFVNSDENVLICRKYGFLRARILLYRQDEISQLERQLIEMDNEDKEIDPIRLRSRKTDEERDENPQFSRKTLMQRIDEKLKLYGMQNVIFVSASESLTHTTF